MKVKTQIQQIVTTVMLVFLLFCFKHTHSQSVTVAGSDWNLDLTGEITEAGNDFTGTYQSATNQVFISVTTTGGNPPQKEATIAVQYNINTLWHNDLVIEILRTGNGQAISNCQGAAGCQIVGGVNYQIIAINPTVFFTISGRVNNNPLVWNDIPVQFRLSGISTTIPADDYSAEIIFTISP